MRHRAKAEQQPPEMLADDVEQEVIKFLLPGLGHFMEDDKVRAIILHEQVHELLGEYLSFNWKEYQKVQRVVSNPSPRSKRQRKKLGASAVKEMEAKGLNTDGLPEHLKALHMHPENEEEDDDLNERDSGDSDVMFDIVECLQRGSDLEKRMCNIISVLAALVLVEAQLVKTHPLFVELCGFAMDNLPFLGEWFKLGCDDFRVYIFPSINNIQTRWAGVLYTAFHFKVCDIIF